MSCDLQACVQLLLPWRPLEDQDISEDPTAPRRRALRHLPDLPLIYPDLNDRYLGVSPDFTASTVPIITSASPTARYFSVRDRLAYAFQCWQAQISFARDYFQASSMSLHITEQDGFQFHFDEIM